jgi:RecA-family ATPase
LHRALIPVNELITDAPDGTPPRELINDMANGLEALSNSDPAETAPISVASLADEPVPIREWFAANLIPAKYVTLLSGDGGTGKSLLAAQLAVAGVTGGRWLGLDVKRGPVLYLGAEDDQDEMHRRFAAIANEQGISLDRLENLHLHCRAGNDAVLFAADEYGVMQPTPLWHEHCRHVKRLRPELVIYDPLADLFAGNENSRSQARQCIGMTRGLALETSSTALVLAHPSLSGLASGTGTSGSTAWSNSVRSRLYLDRVREGDTEPDPNARVLRTMKSNYGPTGGEIRLRWVRGVFTLESNPANVLAQQSKDRQAESVFLGLLATYGANGRAVTDTTGANYAPVLFAREDSGKVVGKAALEGAMRRLFEGGRIRIVEYGPASRRCKRMEVV